MKRFDCECCGSSKFTVEGGYRVCDFCGTRYQMEKTDIPVVPKTSNIALGNDVQILLQKCQTDPSNAKRYAALILDIDPRNQEAQRILNNNGKRRW